MMKNYASLALGLTLCLTATAAPYQAVSSFGGDLVDSPVATKMVKVDSPKRVASESPQKISSMDELYGDWQFQYYNMLGEGGWNLTTMMFDPSDEENTILISGLLQNVVLKATVDMANSTITLKKQYAFTQENQDIYFQPYRFYWGEPTENGTPLEDYQPLESITGKIENGMITFDQDDGMGFPNPSKKGYFYGYFCFNMTMAFMPLVEINLNDWHVFDEPGVLKEGWMSPAFTDQDIQYPVKVAANNSNKNLVLIIDAYNNEVWSEINESKEGGYIEIDMSNPDLVMCVPRIFSGFENEEVAGGRTYNFNMEGYLYYLNNLSEEEIDDYFWQKNLEYSTFDEAENTVYIYNCVFGNTVNKNAPLSWTTQDNQPVEMTSILTLPEEYKTFEAGVEGIEFDSNAPVKYFNLQGMEVANPAKGQLVIKRQGSKAQKMIVR